MEASHLGGPLPRQLVVFASAEAIYATPRARQNKCAGALVKNDSLFPNIEIFNKNPMKRDNLYYGRLMFACTGC